MKLLCARGRHVRALRRMEQYTYMRRTLRHRKVLGNIGLVRRIASFIPDKERGEGEEEEENM